MDIRSFVTHTLGKDESGHDLGHVERVLANVRLIQTKEGGDLAYLEACALLHDCLDSKLGLDNEEQEGHVYALLLDNGFEEDKALAMLSTMKRMSFHLHDETNLTLEDKIIRDADRLDALGKEGARRALAYGNSRGRPLFSAENLRQISNGQTPTGESTIAHFFDKLLILDQHLYTDTAKAMAVPLKQQLIEALEELYASAGLVLDKKALPKG